jgi:LCP family protein required for cell wall assembly
MSRDHDSDDAPGRPARPTASSRRREQAPRRRGQGSRRPSVWHRHSTASLILGTLAIVLAVVFSGGSVFVYMKYRSAWDGIKRIDVSGDLKGKLPPIDPHALNLLLIGSDTRAGLNGKIGGRTGIGGARSDTIMVLHIAPGARQVDVVSIPRDSVVPILNCTKEAGTPGQTAQPGQVEQINSTFAYGGPGCLWETVEKTTGIHINDFIELNFVGFEKAIDALGGVTVCLPAAVNDPMSGLHLTAGRHHVGGREALAFWRTREDLGLGDDPQRIQRDQFLMASLLQGIERTGLLHSPTKMLSVINALTSHHYVTTDEQLTPDEMLRIAEDLRGISTERVQFVTVPWTAYVNNANWVQWEVPQAGNLFSAISHDTRLPKGAGHKKSEKKAATLKPSQVQVAVYNGSTRQGLGSTTATTLAVKGFQVIGQATNAPTDTYTKSVIEYAAAAGLPAAQTLAKQVGGPVTLRADAQLTGSTVRLILGSEYSSVTSSSGSTSGVENLASTYGGISGNVNICSDQAAFAGPDGQ